MFQVKQYTTQNTGFNLTKMELKRDKIFANWFDGTSFNLTKMELKHGYQDINLDNRKSFNLTRMELKPDRKYEKSAECSWI